MLHIIKSIGLYESPASVVDGHLFPCRDITVLFKFNVVINYLMFLFVISSLAFMPIIMLSPFS